MPAGLECADLSALFHWKRACARVAGPVGGEKR